jgi:hypothetical protein
MFLVSRFAKLSRTEYEATTQYFYLIIFLCTELQNEQPCGFISTNKIGITAESVFPPQTCFAPVACSARRPESSSEEAADSSGLENRRHVAIQSCSAAARSPYFSNSSYNFG